MIEKIRRRKNRRVSDKRYKEEEEQKDQRSNVTASKKIRGKESVRRKGKALEGKADKPSQRNSHVRKWKMVKSINRSKQS